MLPRTTSDELVAGRTEQLLMDFSLHNMLGQFLTKHIGFYHALTNLAARIGMRSRCRRSHFVSD
jgi:hypothetical protein